MDVVSLWVLSYCEIYWLTLLSFPAPKGVFEVSALAWPFFFCVSTSPSFSNFSLARRTLRFLKVVLFVQNNHS